MNHLNKYTIDFVLRASDEERIQAAKKFNWIGYTEANNVMKKMEDLMNYPKCSRMPNLLLVGDSNNGKTVILQKFDKKYEPFISESEEKVINHVLLIQSPPEPDEKRFYNSILEKLYAPTKTTERIEARQNRVIDLLKKLETKILIIDEIHHVLAGQTNKQRLFLNVIKYLSNELQIPIVCAGTREAFNAIQTDPQLANRFEPKVLPKWTNNIELKRLLKTFESVSPLKNESHLIENSMTNKILAMSGGLIGEISKIIELGTILAIESKIEKITPKILDSIDYVSPDKRKKMIYK
jgi:type II secretory pathway predicted ATPase ExeA